MLATPRLSGTILPGITRDSILQLARAWGGCEVEERPVTIEEVRQVREREFAQVMRQLVFALHWW